MARPRIRTASLLLAALLLASACSTTGGDQAMGRISFGQAGAATGPAATTPVPLAPSQAPPPPSTTATSAAPTTSAAPAPPATAPATTPPTPPPTTIPPLPRVVVEQAWTPFATAGGVTLVHPSSQVERVGFHQSNHEGARQLEPLPTAVAPATLETRDRLTAARTAADVVIHPGVEVRAPVTGTVKRAGTYVLYCEYSDDFVVIEPDAHPGWEVKILHINGVRVGAGDRVIAGQSVIAPGPTPLPFASQVDELTPAATAWPHVHIEVIDLAIPDRPSPGGGC